MNISLTPELEKYIYTKVKSGLYTSASEVVRESLRIMHMHDDLQGQRVREMDQLIDAGLKQLATNKKVMAQSSYNRIKNKIKKNP